LPWLPEFKEKEVVNTMNVLFISEDLVAGNLAYLLSNEGHEVKLYIKDRGRRDNFENLVPKVQDWKKELRWVGKKGLIVFDSCSHGKIQDDLRREGYSVVGGCEIGDKLENDRVFGAGIFKLYGMQTVPQFNFKSIDAAIRFIKKRRGKWVIKQNFSGTGLKSFNYVGILESGDDVINVLNNYKTHYKIINTIITLQQKIDGVEIAAGRYFNGSDWISPIEMNIEHKKLFPGDLGPSTSEMGTIAWYDNDENNKLFKETLGKLKPFLIDIGFRGDIDINCIVNDKGAFPLEATARFGSPIIHLHSEIHSSPWGEFLKCVADGRTYKLRWKKGFGIVVVVTVPTSQPFPFTKSERYISPKGLNIYFSDKIKKGGKLDHIHFEDVSMRFHNREKQYYISDDRGYVLYVTSIGKTVEEVRKKANILLNNIYIPKMFFRNDIGIRFLTEDAAKLEKWGYLNTI
jgi:phosphoribosylamine--glycine ligase